MIAGGRLFGVLELFIIGAASGALVVASISIVLLARLRLAVARNVTPPRVYAGSPSRVELSIRNDGDRSTPVLRLFDAVTGTRGADLLLSPLEPDVVNRAAYRLPTERRGVIEIGPLEVVVTDPFGLASSSTIAAPLAELTVYPHIDDIVPVPHTTGDDPYAGADHPSALGRTGEDFYALRPYVVGDDLRRVHWRSTARRDELMVRQDELPWQGRVTILLDVRRTAHTPESLELAVSAAASIVTACWKRRDLVRFMTTDNTDFGYGAGTAHAEATMEFLATVASTPSGTLRGLLGALEQAGNGGAIVPIVADLADAELSSLGLLRRRFASVTVVQFLRSSYDGSAETSKDSTAASAGNATMIRVSRDLPFSDAWNGALHRGRKARAAR
jgi:uncharacterized protein (DUF58 family)